MRRIERIVAVLCAMSVLVLSACGGVGTGTGVAALAGGVGTGGTGIVFGAITGFGSIVIDGSAYSSATAQYFAGSDKGESVEASAASLGLGNQVQLKLDAQGNPASVIIEPALVGAVSRLGQSQFVVNGMTVRVNGSAAAGPLTYFSGLSGFASLSSGMQVAVHGAYGVDAGSQLEYIQATLIEQLPGTNTANRLSGTVAKLDAAAGTFQLGDTTVRMSASTGILPSGTALANGLWVNVWSNTALGTGGELRAGVIRVRNLSGTTGQVQLSGIVSRLSGTQFQVSGIAIDAGATALSASLRSLKSGEYVVVQGRPDARGSALVASSIRTYAAQPAQVALKGTITDFVNQGSFLVRGVPVDATQAQLLGAASGAGLRNGMYVEVSGSVSGVNGNLISAKSVAAQGKAPAGGTVNYRGSVSQFDAASGSFVLTGSLDEDGASILVRLAPNVAYANGGAVQLGNGASVEVEATKNAGDIVAYGVFFRKFGASSGGPSGGKLETEGLAYGVTSSAFSVNGLTIQINGVIAQGGSLVSGARVEVEFTQSGGQNLAQNIAVDR
jgi:hypothetical protein